MERETAEKSLLTLEDDGKSLKEVLFSAIARIDNLEASQAHDRKEMQHLRGEVKLAMEGVRAAVKATEAAQGACQKLEKNLVSKVNNASSQLSKVLNSGQSVLLQNGLKAVQASVSNIRSELFSLSSRASALEKQNLQLEQQFHQHQQPACQNQPAKEQHFHQHQQLASQNLPVKEQQFHQHQQPACQSQQAKAASKPVRTVSQQKVSSRTQQNAVGAGIRENSQRLPSNRIEIIPIRDILNPPAKKSDPNKALQSNAVVVSKQIDTVKDGSSDVTVQDNDNVAAESEAGEHVQLLSSITRLFLKEKRAHSKIEAKLCELEKVFRCPGFSAPATEPKQRNNKRKYTTADEGHAMKAKKSGDDGKGTGTKKSKRKKKKMKEDELISDDDLDDEEIPVPKPVEDPQVDKEAPDIQPVLPVACTQTQPAPSVGCNQPVLSPIVCTQPVVPSLMCDQPVLCTQAACQLNKSFNDEEAEIDTTTSIELPDVVILSDDFNAASLSAVFVSTKKCFVDDAGELKPSDSWGMEFKEHVSVHSVNTPMSTLMLILASCLTSILTKQHSLVHQLAAFVSEVLEGEAFNFLVKFLSSFLVLGKKQSVKPAAETSSDEATAEEVVAASKLLAAVCETSENFRLLQNITYRILRWSQMDNMMLATSLASLSSVSKQLLTDTGAGSLTSAIRCFAAELVAEVDKQNVSNSADMELLRVGVPVDETAEFIVKTALDLLLCSSENPGFDLVKEIGLEDYKTATTEKVLPWGLRFQQAAEALELVALHMGWEWTYNELIVGKLWSLVAPGAAQITVAGVAYLLGNLGRLGTGDEMPGVDELRQRLAVILKEVTSEQGKLTLSTRLVAARALLELCIVDRKAPRWGDDEDESTAETSEVLNSEYVKVVQEWFQSLDAEEQRAVPRHLKNRIFLVRACA